MSAFSLQHCLDAFFMTQACAELRSRIHFTFRCSTFIHTAQNLPEFSLTCLYSQLEGVKPSETLKAEKYSFEMIRFYFKSCFSQHKAEETYNPKSLPLAPGP